MGIKFNDQHIPDSPHKLYIAPAMGDAHKLEIAQFPEGSVQPDKPYTFLVRKNGAKGELDGKVRYIAVTTIYVYNIIRSRRYIKAQKCLRSINMKSQPNEGV